MCTEEDLEPIIERLKDMNPLTAKELFTPLFVKNLTNRKGYLKILMYFAIIVDLIVPLLKNPLTNDMAIKFYTGFSKQLRSGLRQSRSLEIMKCESWVYYTEHFK